MIIHGEGESQRYTPKGGGKVNRCFDQFKKSLNTSYLTLNIFTTFPFLFKHFPIQSKDYMQI